MKLRSFRIRIALLSAIFSCLVLAGFGAVAWAGLWRMGLKQIDEKLLSLGHSHLSATPAPGHWEDIEKAFKFIHGEDGEEVYIILVQGADGRVHHRSANWPEELQIDQTELADPQAPSPDALDGMFAEGPPVRRDEDFRPGPDGRLPPPPFGKAPLGGEFGSEGPGSWDRPGAAPRLNQGQPRRREAPPLGEPESYTREANERKWRLAVMANDRIILAIGMGLEPFETRMSDARNAFLIALPIALLLIGLGGAAISHRALRPVRNLSRSVEGVTAKGLDQRIAQGREDSEFERLICVFNEMMDRLERSFLQARRFSADAAHELKTPLAILQGKLESSLQRSPEGSEEQRELTELLEETHRLKSIIEKLLLLTRADSGRLKLHLEQVDLAAIVRDVCEDTTALAPELEVKEDIVSSLPVTADRALMVQVLQNLSSNAIKYNQLDGKIRFVLRKENSAARFTIANTGPGIPESDRKKIFERFYRGDKSRSRHIEGFGLGLSLSREIARAHNGDLVLEPTKEGIVAFTLTTPIGKNS